VLVVKKAEVRLVRLRKLITFRINEPRPTTLLPPRSNGKPETATAVDNLKMMSMKMPEKCWTVFKRHLRDWCIWFVDLFEDILCLYFTFNYRTCVIILRPCDRWIFSFHARSHSSNERLLAVSCLLVCPHITVMFPRDGYQWNFIVGTSRKFVQAAHSAEIRIKVSHLVRGKSVLL
jgi:hypothetical protein